MTQASARSMSAQAGVRARSGSGQDPKVLRTAGIAKTTGESRVEHGRYLVEHVAMCVQCHTPRTKDGELIRGELLRGAPIPVESPFPGREWALQAPNIAGLLGYTEETAIRLLTEGIARSGQPPRPPMPPFRMTRGDAEDIVAYLMSLQQGSH